VLSTFFACAWNCFGLAVTFTDTAAILQACCFSGVLLNLISAGLFIYDKNAACSGDERVPEFDLLLSLAAGGETTTFPVVHLVGHLCFLPRTNRWLGSDEHIKA